MNWIELDRQHVWHPYNSLPSKSDLLSVKSTDKTSIFLEDGRELIDGMSSWWSCIHGYNHPRLIKAIKDQADIMPHIMFGGIAHEKASILASKLAKLTGLNSVFLCDSGSVSVEVALKTAIQYQEAKGLKKYKFISLEHAYHGDTLAAMSVCDPNNSMHSIYGSYLPKHIFTQAPELGFTADCSSSIKALEDTFLKHEKEVAGFILEPVVQGAGGMRIYNPEFLRKARELCSKYDILLIADEIATGFGHTGKMFACDWADIKPDIMTLGKGLTGGYMTMAAMITSKEVSDTISNSNLGILMHGPTFMGNPLACSVAIESLNLLEEGSWQKNVLNIEKIFKEELSYAKELNIVKDIRNIGAIGVIELKDESKAQEIQDYCVEHGVWIRPFGKLIYSIVAYTIKDEDLRRIIKTMIDAIKSIETR
ncbi:adenosylmethionine--8-amino-7-oxononanoate transaminase [Poseidonibacter ostreae]|uniref:Adenosylmethionine-8-amino-7-oxononanoate aminotransferase n=1 Tax=Poseidonibacter ostreae TaxID=2654171 RepID=A0A6L4WUV1_9BACT|nr:adenosylmethionine--8-amino-7-oxononanoate transaminase [Poseidonibacter ostreae]KAB7884810.1 adenosylmethionine--8-amino-7-oxononanoate transaminase [Poseidonibacter ostreae]KAB7890168.1 adenosylmethionine--8-amino-7-oxononanoate transaminase [Poseidonibacter ostreae]KAB7892585.1 adenosylmethionine--8-amino-7-oxononanoate transaminase [Poseidonibacter ostreae]MAC83848.1 adenosylmethionine--8-amino-7-oxononanoate transaminase [Arcobacter sp.]